MSKRPVGEDLTAAGFNVHIHRNAAVDGNTRLAACCRSMRRSPASLVIAAFLLDLEARWTG